MGSSKQNVWIKLENNFNKEVYGNDNVKWCMLGRAFLSGIGHFCVDRAFLCRKTMHFAVERVFVSYECYNKSMYFELFTEIKKITFGTLQWRRIGVMTSEIPA